MPHLVNLNEDPLMSECLICERPPSAPTVSRSPRPLRNADQIKSGRTTVGNIDSETPADIRLSGDNILPEHCYFESAADGKVTLHSVPNGTTMVNGQRVSSHQVGSVPGDSEQKLTSAPSAEGAAVWLPHHPR